MTIHQCVTTVTDLRLFNELVQLSKQLCDLCICRHDVKIPTCRCLVHI